MTRKNTRLTLDVTGISNEGYGVAHAEDGRVVFVRHAVPGERVKATVIKETPRYLVAKTDDVLIPSKKRTENGCPAKNCGGCVYRDITYAYEKEIKREDVRHAFTKVGLDVTVTDVVSTDVTARYRNKASYPVATAKNGRLVAGFYAPSSHTVVPVADCGLQPEIFGRIVNVILDFCTENGIRAYDETTGDGVLRHIYLRCGTVTGELGVCLVTTGARLENEGALIGRLVSRFPKIVSIVYNFNKKDTNVILGDTFKTVYGEGHIRDVLCGCTLEITPGAFYQVNHDACEKLYGLVAEKAALTGKETVLDLYCGIGSIGLSLSAKAKRIIGVEVEKSAADAARRNAKLNGFANAEYFCADASDSEKFLSAAENGSPIEDAVVILDPPRKGTTQTLMDAIAHRGYDRVVYVSCNPDTLARDCLYFTRLGYTVGEVTPVDMFPRTGHVETVVLLSRMHDEDRKKDIL